MFGVKVPINQFVFLLSLVPICVVFLCFSEKILGLQRSLQKELSTKERFVSLGVLSAGLAHEMNNPLHNLSMNVHVLKVNLGKNNIENIEAHQEKIEKIVDKILKSVSRVNGIVESINSFAKNNLLLKPSIDLTEIIKQSLFSFEEKILSKNLNVSTQFHNVEMVTVAPNAIQQIFCNLFSNSIYAVGDGGRIHINAGLENHELRFSVFDDGPGIPEDIQTHIFDPFFTTKKTGEGMGLGLWISSQLVSAHGGQIVCSKPETGGTLIEIIIPQGKEPQFKLPKIIKEKINKSSMFLEMNG
jgi:signal transduction histidine kinase